MWFWILLIILFGFFGHLQAKYNASPKGRAEQEAKRRKKAARNAYKNIQYEAYKKYPNVLHWKEREEYIERCLNGEDPE